MAFFRWLFIIVAVIYRLEEPVNGQNCESSILRYLTSNATDLIDKVLTAYKTEIINSGNADGRIYINDANITFDYELWPVKLNATVRVKDGMFRNVLTARQSAPPTVEHVGQSVTIGVHIGLELFDMSFDYVEATTFLLNVTGAADVSVSKNSAYIEIVIDLNPCSVRLTKFRIEEFSGLDVKTRVSNILGWFSDKLTKAILTQVPKISEDNYEKYFSLSLEKALCDADICQILAKV